MEKWRKKTAETNVFYIIGISKDITKQNFLTNGQTPSEQNLENLRC